MKESITPLFKVQQAEKTAVVTTATSQKNPQFRLFEPDEVIPESYLKEDIHREFGLDIGHLTDETKRKWAFLRSDLWGYTLDPNDPDDAITPPVFTINGMQAYVDETSKDTDLSPYTKEKLTKIQRLINHVKTEPLCPIDRPIEIRKTFIPEITDAPILDANELAEAEIILKTIPFPEQEQVTKKSPQQEPSREFTPVKKEPSVTNTKESTSSPIPAAQERPKSKLVEKEDNIFKSSAIPDYMTVEGIRLDPDNEQFFQAAAFVLQTDRIIFLTGKAGTGKTTFLKYICQFRPKTTIVLAPTGRAAINAGGQTIHSFFRLEPGPYPYMDNRIYSQEIYKHLKYNTNKISIIENMTLLIIDEISMVRCDVLDVIDHILRVFRKQPHLPFGGVQVLLMGDPYQLPPVVMDSDWEILKQDYQGKYFFDSKIYQAINPLYIELEKPYRQTEEEFINLLNKIRINELSQEELTSLNNKVNNILPTQGSIIVGSTNRIVNDHNLSKLHKLPNELITLEGTTTGTFPESMMVAEQRLQLKIGAQVMILRNKWLNEFCGFEYYNGSIGIIQDIQQDSPRITIKLTDKSDRIVHIDPVTWKNIEYKSVKDEFGYTKIQSVTIGTYTQFPLKLAWAITIHKSQGLSFESIIADIGWTQPGLVYVALSRCRKLSGLFLKSRISIESLKVDSRIAAFVKSKIPDSIIIKELEAGKANRLYKEAWEKFDKGDFNTAYALFYAAVKIRDDRETPIMETTLAKRYKQLLRHQRQRMQWFQKFKFTLRENQKLNNQIEENNTTHCAEQKILLDTITLLKNTIITKDEEIKINKSQTKELQEASQQEITEIGKLNTRAEELEISLEEQKQTIQELCATIQNQTSNLKSQTSRIFDMQRKITQKQQKITDYEAIMRCQSQEIERLQALTWHQKLFGKKVR